jgi:YVTN family beta-propeller protein
LSVVSLTLGLAIGSHCSPTFAEPFAYITNYGSGTLSVIDTATDAVVATVPVGAQPFGVAIHPSGQKVYVTTQGDSSVWVVDAPTNTVRTTVAGAGGYGIAASPDGQSVYAAGLAADGNLSLSVIRSDTDQLVRSISLGIAGPVTSFSGFLGIVLSSDGAFAYVMAALPDSEQFPCSISSTNCTIVLHKIDTVTGDEVGFFEPLGLGAFRPVGISFDPSGTDLYLADSNAYGQEYQLPILSASTLFLTGYIKAAWGAPSGIAFDHSGQKLFVADSGLDKVWVVDTTKNTVVGFVDVGRNPFGLAVDAASGRVYVANTESDTVSAIDPVSMDVVDTIPVGHFPEAFGQFIGPPGVTLVPTPTNTPATPPSCVGDCDGDNSVTINELITGVNIALGIGSRDGCLALNCNGGALPSIDCLILALNNALYSCHPPPPPTPTENPCGEVCDGRPCGESQCPGGLTGTRFCTVPRTGACECSPVECPTLPPMSPTPTSPPITCRPTDGSIILLSTAPTPGGTPVPEPLSGTFVMNVTCRKLVRSSAFSMSCTGPTARIPDEDGRAGIQNMLAGRHRKHGEN